MANQNKFITSHRSRVRRAEKVRKESPEKISIFDREAYVEFYLLEDIVRLYEFRLEREQKKIVETRQGQITKERNIRKFSAILNVFKAAIEIAWGEIDSGNYKVVWKNIPEHSLMVAANSLKYLNTLCSIGTEMLDALSSESMTAEEAVVALDEAADKLEAHEANTRTVKGLPSPEEIMAIINEAKSAIAETDVTPLPKPSSNPVSRLN